MSSSTADLTLLVARTEGRSMSTLSVHPSRSAGCNNTMNVVATLLSVNHSEALNLFHHTNKNAKKPSVHLDPQFLISILTILLESASMTQGRTEARGLYACVAGTHLSISQQRVILLSQLVAHLIVVDPFGFVAFLKFFTNNSCFHGTNP